jgi:hypothetical protein
MTARILVCLSMASAIGATRAADLAVKEATIVAASDGARIVEELLAYDAGKHNMTYRINASPLPVPDYVATLAVTPPGKGIVGGIYQAGFDGLRAALGEIAR